MPKLFVVAVLSLSLRFWSGEEWSNPVPPVAVALPKKKGGLRRIGGFLKRQAKKDLKVLKKVAPIAIAVVGVAVPVVGVVGGVLLAGMKAYEKQRAAAKAAKKEAELQRQEEAAYELEMQPERAQPYSERTTRTPEEYEPPQQGYDTIKANKPWWDISGWFN